MNNTSQQPGSDGLVDISAGFKPSGGSNPYGFSQVQSTQQQPQKPKENWFERLLPTIGSIAAPVIGAALAPETGGLSLLAAAALSGAGAGAGKAAENIVTGQGVGQGVLGEAAGGFGGGLAGGIAGKGISALGGLAEKTGAGMLTKAATAAEQAAEPTVITQLQKDLALEKKLSANFGSITPRLQGESGFALKTNAQKVQDFGFDKTSPQDMNTVSKAGLEMNAVLDQGLQKSKPVSTEGFLKNIIDTGGAYDMSANQTPLGKALIASKIPLPETGGKLPAVFEATDMRKVSQNIGTQLRNLQTKINAATSQGNIGTDVQALEQQHMDLLKLKDTIDTRLYTKNSVVNNSINNFKSTPEQRATWVSTYGNKLGNHIADTLDNATSAKEVVGAMKPFAQMGHASNMAIDDIKNVAGTRSILRNKLALQEAEAAAGGTPPPPPVQPNEAANTLSTVAPKLGAIAKGFNAAAQSPATAKGLKKFGPVLERAGKFGAPAGAAIGTLGGLVAAPVGGANMNQQQGTGAQQQPITELFKQLLAQEQAGAGLTNNSGALLSALQALAGPAQQTQMLGQAQQGLQQGFQNAGGPQGLLGGGLTNLTGLIPGTAANQYQRNQALYGSLMQQLYGIPAGQAGAATPQFTQTPGTAGIAGGLAGI